MKICGYNYLFSEKLYFQIRKRIILHPTVDARYKDPLRSTSKYFTMGGLYSGYN